VRHTTKAETNLLAALGSLPLCSIVRLGGRLGGDSDLSSIGTKVAGRACRFLSSTNYAGHVINYLFKLCDRLSLDLTVVEFL